MLGPDGLSRFEDLRRREAARSAILYAFDLIEYDGEDLRNLPFLGRKAALARLLRETEAGILLKRTPRTALPSSRMLAGSVPRVSFRRRSMARIDLARVASGSKSAIPPASRCSGSAARIRIGEPPAVRADDDSPRDNAQEQYALSVDLKGCAARLQQVGPTSA